MTASVQKASSGSGSQQIDPIAEASGQWREGLEAQSGAARVDGVIKPNLVQQAAYQSLVAPTASGVPLRELPPDVAQEILDARAEAMKEFFGTWADSIRKNAAADKKAAFRVMLKQARLKAVGQARALISGRTSAEPNPTSSNRPALPNRAPGSSAATVKPSPAAFAPNSVDAAFEQRPSAGFGLRGGSRNT